MGKSNEEIEGKIPAVMAEICESGGSQRPSFGPVLGAGGWARSVHAAVGGHRSGDQAKENPKIKEV